MSPPDPNPMLGPPDNIEMIQQQLHELAERQRAARERAAAEEAERVERARVGVVPTLVGAVREAAEVVGHELGHAATLLAAVAETGHVHRLTPRQARALDAAMAELRDATEVVVELATVIAFEAGFAAYDGSILRVVPKPADAATRDDEADESSEGP